MNETKEGIENKLEANIDRKDNSPRDVYALVAEKVRSNIEKVEDNDIKNSLCKLKIERKLLKKPVMTVPYNVSYPTMCEQLLAQGFFTKHFDSLDVKKNNKTYFYKVSKDILKEEYQNECIKLSSKEFALLTAFLYKSVYLTFPRLDAYVKYMKNMASLFARLNLELNWTTPVGMKIGMRYVKTEQYRGKDLYLNKSGSSVSLPTDVPDRKGNEIAFMPNFIHSMDSANIQLLVLNLIKSKNYINLFTIHDCFATTPDTMKLLNAEVRKAFAMMYFDQDYIEKLHKDFLNQINQRNLLWVVDREVFEKNKNNKAEITEEVKFENCISFDSLKENQTLAVQSIDFIDKNPRIKPFLVPVPELPYQVDWKSIKAFLEAGILASTYFIN